MKFISVLFLICFQLSGGGEINQDEAGHSVEKYMNAFDQALIGKDVSTLRRLLHNDLTLGHSNGWMETKSDLLQTLVSGNVVYESIEMIGEPLVYYETENLITVRRNIDVQGIVNEQAFNVKLNVLEIWIDEAGKWQLLARQSVDRR